MTWQVATIIVAECLVLSLLGLVVLSIFLKNKIAENQKRKETIKILKEALREAKDKKAQEALIQAAIEENLSDNIAQTEQRLEALGGDPCGELAEAEDDAQKCAALRLLFLKAEESLVGMGPEQDSWNNYLESVTPLTQYVAYLERTKKESVDALTAEKDKLLNKIDDLESRVRARADYEKIKQENDALKVQCEEKTDSITDLKKKLKEAEAEQPGQEAFAVLSERESAEAKKDHNFSVILQQNAKLQGELKKAQSTLLATNQTNLQLVKLTNFVRRTISCNDVENLAKIMMTMHADYGLTGAVKIDSEEDDSYIFHSSSEENKAADLELISQADPDGVVQEYGDILVIGFDTLSLLFRGMPIDDPEQLSRLKSHIQILMEVCFEVLERIVEGR